MKWIAEILYEIRWVDESTNDYGFILPEDKRHHMNREMSAKYKIHSQRVLFAYENQGVDNTTKNLILMIFIHTSVFTVTVYLMNWKINTSIIFSASFRFSMSETDKNQENRIQLTSYLTVVFSIDLLLDNDRLKKKI